MGTWYVSPDGTVYMGGLPGHEIPPDSGGSYAYFDDFQNTLDRMTDRRLKDAKARFLDARAFNQELENLRNLGRKW